MLLETVTLKVTYILKNDFKSIVVSIYDREIRLIGLSF